jgi:serine/threonine-protein kinase RsbW
MPQDTITLTVPASAEYARTVRMTAAAVVARMPFTYDEVEDVRMAAEEAFIYAVDTLPEEADVTFQFVLHGAQLEMDVTLGGTPDVSDEEVERRATYASFILQSVCESCELASDADGHMFLRLLKRAESADAI